MAGERFPYQSSGERGRQGRQSEEGKEGRWRRERRGGEGGGEGGDETDIHSKRVLALVILSLFFVQHSLVCVCQRCLSQSKLLH